MSPPNDDSAALEVRRAALEAFTGLNSHGVGTDSDLAGRLKSWAEHDFAVDDADPFIPLHWNDIEAAARRILELQEIVRQNALVAESEN